MIDFNEFELKNHLEEKFIFVLDSVGYTHICVSPLASSLRCKKEEKFICAAISLFHYLSIK